MAAAVDRPDLECSTALHSETSHDRSDVDMRSSDDDEEGVRACEASTQHASTLASNAYCSLGCGRRIIGKRDSRAHGDGRAHSTCIRAAEKRPASLKRRQQRSPSPPPARRESSRRRHEAASAMASLSAVVAEFQNSNSFTAVEPEPATASLLEPPAAAASAAPSIITSNPPEPSDVRLPHSKLAEPLNSEHYRAHPDEMMKAYGYAMLDPTTASTTMAKKIAELELDDLMRPDHPHRFSVISGNVRQVNLTSAAQYFTRADQNDWETIMAEAFRRCGLEQEASGLHLVATKALDAKPGDGEQPVHFDSADAWAASDRFSVILVCSTGTHTTAMPRFCAPTEFPWKSADDVPQRDLQRVCHLLDAEWYHRVRAKIGTIIIFRESVPHHGTRNPKKTGNRRVLFSMWSSKKGSSQDDYQEYPWMTVAKAYGADSIETAHSLVAHAQHRPIERMDGPTHKAYTDCLRHHRLVKEFNAASESKH